MSDHLLCGSDGDALIGYMDKMEFVRLFMHVRFPGTSQSPHTKSGHHSGPSFSGPEETSA